MITRRGLLGGIAGMLVAGRAAAIVHNPMKLWTPRQELDLDPRGTPLKFSDIPLSLSVGDTVQLTVDGKTNLYTISETVFGLGMAITRQGLLHIKTAQGVHSMQPREEPIWNLGAYDDERIERTWR